MVVGKGSFWYACHAGDAIACSAPWCVVFRCLASHLAGAGRTQRDRRNNGAASGPKPRPSAPAFNAALGTAAPSAIPRSWSTLLFGRSIAAPGSRVSADQPPRASPSQSMRIGHSTTVVTTSLASSIGDGVRVTPPRIFGAAVHARATADFSLPEAPPPNDLARLSVKRSASSPRDDAAAQASAMPPERRGGHRPRAGAGVASRVRRIDALHVIRVRRSGAGRITCGASASTPSRSSTKARCATPSPLALNARERKLIEGARERELATTIFSAKESLFKCLYPRVGVFFDFEDAEVEWIVKSAFGVRLQRDLSADFGRGLLLEGRQRDGRRTHPHGAGALGMSTLSDHDRHRLLVEWNGPEARRPPRGARSTSSSRSRLARRPQTIALEARHGDLRITYAGDSNAASRTASPTLPAAPGVSDPHVSWSASASSAPPRP